MNNEGEKNKQGEYYLPCVTALAFFFLLNDNNNNMN